MSKKGVFFDVLDPTSTRLSFFTIIFAKNILKNLKLQTRLAV
jgi:hypothetical protein